MLLRSGEQPIEHELAILLSHRLFHPPYRERRDKEGVIEVPLPGTPSLEVVKELIILLGEGDSQKPLDLYIEELRYLPASEECMNIKRAAISAWAI